MKEPCIILYRKVSIVALYFTVNNDVNMLRVYFLLNKIKKLKYLIG